MGLFSGKKKYAAHEGGGRVIVRTNDLRAAKALARVAEGSVTKSKRGKEVEVYSGRMTRNPVSGVTAKNPGTLWFSTAKKRDAALTALRGAGYSGFGRWSDGTKKDTGKPAYFLAYSGSSPISELERVLVGKKNPAKKNPEAGAAELYEAFHGKPSDRYIEVTEEFHWHENLAELGDVVELKVKTITGLDAKISFDVNEGEFPVKLSSSEDGKQLFFVGGDQELDLGVLGMNGENWVRDSMVIGDVYMLTYNTEKGFDGFEPITYFHRMAEDGGIEPTLVYDSINKTMSLAGGSYTVKPEGIVN